MEEIEKNAGEAANFLKGIASPHRLMVLCKLMEGEKNVGDLIKATNIAQTSMSQHLSKLKKEKIVSFRRDHRTLYYYISSDLVRELINVLYKNFCQKNNLGEK